MGRDVVGAVKRRIEIVDGEKFGRGAKNRRAEEITDLPAEPAERNLSDALEVALDAHRKRLGLPRLDRRVIDLDLVVVRGQ